MEIMTSVARAKRDMLAAGKIRKMNNNVIQEFVYRFFSTGVKSVDFQALFQPTCLAGVISWLAFVAAIFKGHENGYNKANKEMA